MNAKEFERQFNALYLPVCMYVLRMTEDLQESEDIAADTFAKAWEYFSDRDAPDNFKAYIYRMARNLTVDRMRVVRPAAALSDVADIPAEEIDTSERDAAVWKAVASLPERCREVFLLSKRDNLSHKEIAAELSISEKTVENQLAKALKVLRNSLSNSASLYDFTFILTFL